MKINAGHVAIFVAAIALATLGLLTLKGCGGSAVEGAPPGPSIEWVTVNDTHTTPTSAVPRGTAWISWDYFDCTVWFLIACIEGTPGVEVTYNNLTTGNTGNASSHLVREPTDGVDIWVHRWSATVPIIPGNNTIRISAYDPNGKGGFITLDVVGGLLQVRSTSPSAGATSVPIDSTISATLNSQINPQSITSSSFIVNAPSGDLTGSLVVNGATATFTPAGNLVCDTTYTVTLTSAVKDIDGFSLASGHTWAFTTGCSLHRALRGVWGIQLFGASGSNAFVVGDHGTILHYDWSNVRTVMPSGTYNNLFGVWGSSGSDVFAVGDNGTILHYDGIAWSAMPSGTTSNLRGVWGSAGNSVFAVGDGSTILFYDGSSWSGITPPRYYDHLSGVWGSSGNDIFFVGDFVSNADSYGVILRKYASFWNTLPFPYITSSAEIPVGIWGTSALDVFVVGKGGGIRHFNGGTWTVMPSDVDQQLNGVWGNSGSSVFAVGDGGTILRYSESVWAAMLSGTTTNLHSVWGSSGSNVFAVGNSGTILHYDGSAWTALPP